MRMENVLLGIHQLKGQQRVTCGGGTSLAVTNKPFRRLAPDRPKQTTPETV